MRQEDFLNITRQAYLDARNFIYKPKFDSILTRGTSHSISSLTEDLFGCYCADKVSEPKGIRILIDPPVSFKGTGLKNKSGKRSLLIRPDVVLTKNNVASCFFDIKTDLGYKRNELFNQAKERSNQLNKIKGKQASYKDGQTKIETTLQISDNIQLIYLVISQGNIKKDNLNAFIQNIRKLDNIGIFLLSVGEHLNSYKDSLEWQINKDDFDKLDKIIEDNINNNN